MIFSLKYSKRWRPHDHNGFWKLLNPSFSSEFLSFLEWFYSSQNSFKNHSLVSSYHSSNHFTHLKTHHHSVNSCHASSYYIRLKTHHSPTHSSHSSNHYIHLKIPHPSVNSYHASKNYIRLKPHHSLVNSYHPLSHFIHLKTHYSSYYALSYYSHQFFYFFRLFFSQIYLFSRIIHIPFIKYEWWWYRRGI